MYWKLLFLDTMQVKLSTINLHLHATLKAEMCFQGSGVMQSAAKLVPLGVKWKEV